MLIGLNSYFKVLTGTIRRGEENEPIALEICLGMILSLCYESPSFDNFKNITNLCFNTTFCKQNEVHEIIENRKKLQNEKDLLKYDTVDTSNINEKNIFDEFRENLEFKENRYHVKVPVKKEFKESLPDNYFIAKNG